MFQKFFVHVLQILLERKYCVLFSYILNISYLILTVAKYVSYLCENLQKVYVFNLQVMIREWKESENMYALSFPF